MVSCLYCSKEIEIIRSRDKIKRFCTRWCWTQYRGDQIEAKTTRFTDSTYNVYALSLDKFSYRYVGATNYVNVDQRRVQWFAQRFRFNNPASQWVRDSCTKNSDLKVEFLGSAVDKDRILERHWIQNLLSLGFDLLNQQTGGDRGFTQPSWNKGLKTGPRRGAK